MSLNAYSKGPVAPTFQNTYQSTYVGLPLDYIGAALQQKQATYDHYLEGQQTLHQGLMGIQAATPTDATYLKQLQKHYDSQLSALADTDLTRPENQRALRDLGAQLSSDKTLQGIQATHARVGELQAQAKKLQAEGKYHQSQAILNRLALERYEQGGGAASGQTLDSEDFMPELDSRKKADDYFSALKGDEQEGLGYLDVGEDGKVAYSSKHGGIGASKVNSTVIGAASDWLQSGEGRQVIKDGLAQGMSPRQAAQYSLNFLRNRGMAHTYSTSSSNFDVAFNKVGDLKRAKKKEKQEAQPTWLPGAQMKPELGKRPEFDKNGNIVSNPGVIESFGAGWGAGASADLPYTQRALMALHSSYNSMFGSTAEKQGLDELIGRKTSDLQKGLELRNRMAASMGKPQVNGEEYYHTRNTWQPTVMPVPSSSKALNDAQAVKPSLSGMTLYDEQGAHHYNDYIKEGDKVEITSDPYTPWPTKYSNHTIAATITSEDGKVRKVYFDGGSQYDYMEVPRTKEDVQAKNTRLYNKAKHHGYARGIEWKWDEKTHQAIPVGEKEGTYDPAVASEPGFSFLK